MNLKRCNRGHFYDVDKFASCPHCAGGMGSVEKTVPIQPNDEIKTEALTKSKLISPEDSTPPNGGLVESIRQTRETIVEEDNAKTISYFETETGVEPVVGWLVCTDGEEKGTCFNLKGGRNFIGRSLNMDIVVKDNSVSREKHAVILYEPKKREFLVQPGESRELFYLNEEVVLGFEKLKPYDVIQVGNTKLTFMPFCSEKFSWEDAKEENRDS